MVPGVLGKSMHMYVEQEWYEDRVLRNSILGGLCPAGLSIQENSEARVGNHHLDEVDQMPVLKHTVQFQ